MRFAESAFKDHRPKAAGIDEQVGLEPAPVLGAKRGNAAVRRHLDLGNARVEVGHAACRCDLAQEATDEHGVEMVAVADVEREARVGEGCAPLVRQAAGDEETVGVRGHVDAVAAEVGVGEEVADRVRVEIGGEGVEVALVPRAIGPAFEPDADLIGGVAPRHPFGLRNAEAVEEGLELGGRTFTDADDPDLARFDQRDLGSAPPPAIVEQTGRHPPGGPAAKDADAAGDGHQRGAIRMAKPPPGAMRRSRRSPLRTRRVSRTRSLPLEPASAVGPSRQMVAT